MSSDPKAMLNALGLKPKHSWGQNFLGDDEVLGRIVDEAMLVPTDVVVELGAGLGHLTRHLLDVGVRLVAVERDRELAAALRGLSLPGRLTLVEANAADLDFAKAASADQVIVVGNLPYHLSSSILFEVLDQRLHVLRAVFLLQQEVVERLSASPGGRDYGVLTVLLGLHFHVEHVFDVPRHRFFPPPKVDSAVVRLSRRSTARAPIGAEARFRRVVKAAFAQRRKTIANSLASDAGLWTELRPVDALRQAGLDPGRRAETLSVEEFAALERALGPSEKDDSGAVRE